MSYPTNYLHAGMERFKRVTIDELLSSDTWRKANFRAFQFQHKPTRIRMVIFDHTGAVRFSKWN